MEDKILQILLDMQENMIQMQNDISSIKEDALETLDILYENNSKQISQLNVRVTKLERRIKELNINEEFDGVNHKILKSLEDIKQELSEIKKDVNTRFGMIDISLNLLERKVMQINEKI